MICGATKKDGNPCKGEAREDGLCIAHMQKHPGAAVSTGTGPTKLKGLRRARNLRVGLRCITMLRPICREGCQDGAEVARDWYTDCPHDPYVGKKQNIEQVPIYSEPLEDGSVTLLRMEDRIKWEAWPHFVEVAVNIQVNSGQGIERGRLKGYILPEELRSPLYPQGIAPMCEFRSCRWQAGLRQYRWGTFCREIEARMVGASATDTAGNLIYGAREVMHEGKKQAHLEKVAI
jgi:hypothetical protein